MLQFGKNLRQARRVADMTQRELARKLDDHLNSKTVCSWEKGRTEPSYVFLPKLAEVLGCTIDDLFKEES